MPLQHAAALVRHYLRRVPRAGVRLGVPPAWFGYRWVPRETVAEYFARHGAAGPEAAGPAGSYRTVHAEAVAHHPLPRNVASRESLPRDRGWWGYSFRDVPARTSGVTRVITLPRCRVACYRDPSRDDDFYPALLTHDGRALDLREVRFRPLHADVLRRAGPAARLERATWILERVYHNHSHWLTAHLPKLLVLRERGGLDDMLLPPALTPTMEGSLRMLDLPPERFRTFDPARPLEVGELTIVQNDRFRPELLRLVQDAFSVPGARPPHRKVYISRARASRRQLVNEPEVWSMLEREGFERVFMEDLPFERQVALMREAQVVVGPHGAGLTNMVFCPPGTHVVEIADLSFPNPNFFALASGLNHPYWLLPGETVGGGHPLERDLRIDVEDVREVVRAIAREV